jgi:hypothetical protein
MADYYSRQEENLLNAIKMAIQAKQLARDLCDSDSDEWKVEKYFDYYSSTMTPEEFWQSSRAQC